MASLFAAIACAAFARPIGVLSLSGMIRFIMHWTLSLGWIDGCGPPGLGWTGVFHAQKGTTIRAAMKWNRSVSANHFNNRSSQLSSFAIGRTIMKRTRKTAAPLARGFVGASPGAEDRIFRNFDARQKTTWIEGDEFVVEVLLLGDRRERQRAHGDADPLGRPWPGRIVKRIARLSDFHHQHEAGRPKLQAFPEFLTQVVVVRHRVRLGGADACHRLPVKTNRATDPVWRRHNEGVDGMVGRASVALWRADRSSNEHGQLGEAVVIGVIQRARLLSLLSSRLRVANRCLELQHVDKLPPRAFLASRLRAGGFGELEKV